MQINRHNCVLSLSGKDIPNIGGGWKASQYDLKDFLQRSKKIGIIFQKINSGHTKALIKGNTINDSLVVSLHGNPKCEAAKDVIRFATKYYIILIAYMIANKPFNGGKSFDFYEKEIFDQKYSDLNYDKLKNNNVLINRKNIIEYVKKQFLNKDSVDLITLKNEALKK